MSIFGMLAFISSSLAHPLDALKKEAYQPSAPKALDIATAVERDHRAEVGFFIDLGAFLRSDYAPISVQSFMASDGPKRLTPAHLKLAEKHVNALVELYANTKRRQGKIKFRELGDHMNLPANGQVWVQLSYPAVDAKAQVTLVVNSLIPTVRLGIVNASDPTKSRLVRISEGADYAIVLKGPEALSVPKALLQRADELRDILRTHENRLSVGARYLELGFVHIIPKGLDHILFVLALFLLALHWKPLLIQISIFTVAHTITLALSILGVIKLSGHIVEPLIALSIAFVAIENCTRHELKPSRMVVIFGFGLLHGLGFAGVLSELGLSKGHFIASLIAFNIGVELGQLAVIAAALGCVGWFRNKDWFRPLLVKPISVVISLIAIYWAVERVWLTG